MLLLALWRTYKTDPIPLARANATSGKTSDVALTIGRTHPGKLPPTAIWRRRNTHADVSYRFITKLHMAGGW